MHSNTYIITAPHGYTKNFDLRLCNRQFKRRFSVQKKYKKMFKTNKTNNATATD